MYQISYEQITKWEPTLVYSSQIYEKQNAGFKGLTSYIANKDLFKPYNLTVG